MKKLFLMIMFCMLALVPTCFAQYVEGQDSDNFKTKLSLAIENTSNVSNIPKTKVGLFVYDSPLEINFKDTGNKNVKTKVDVISQTVKISDDEITAKLLKDTIDRKFNNPSCEYIPLSSLKMPILDYCDRKGLKDLKEFKRENILEFAHEQGMEYVIYVAFSGNVVNNFNYWSFGPSHDANLQADIKVYDVANNNAAYLDQFTAKGHSSTAMRSVREVFPKLLSQIMECNFGVSNLVSLK